MFRTIRYTDSPVVKTYQDIIASACKAHSPSSSDGCYKQKFDKKRDVIVSDSVLVALYYMVRGYKKHIVWLQGVLPEESYLRNNSAFRKWVLDTIEKFVIKRADLLFMVSQEMCRHYESKYKLSLGNKTVVMPCFNETKLNEDIFNLPKKTTEQTFVYLGSLSAWQCFEETLELYREIEKKSNGNTKLYIFTAEQDKAKELAEKWGISNIQIDYAKPDELSKKIAHIKYGFIIRKDCTVNRVATPTKISNYLANAIIPIYSDCLKSFSEIDNIYQIGICCDAEDLETSTDKILKHMELSVSAQEVGEKCRKVFDEYYSKEKYVAEIEEKLIEIFGESKA